MAKKEETGKVIPFPKRPKPAAKEPLEGDDIARVLNKKAFMVLMRSIAAPVPASLEPALRPPAKMYAIGRASVSSDPDKNISGLTFALNNGHDPSPDLIEDAPDYAFDMTYRKSTSYFVLLDKSRKILVMAALGNSLGDGLDWDNAVTAIDMALDEKRALETKGEKFDLLVTCSPP